MWTRPPAASIAAAAGSAWRSRNGTAGTPMSRRVGLVEEAVAEDLRRDGERRVLGRQVERRQGDQVPERVDRVLRLAVRAQPRGEGLVVERRVGRVELAELRRRAGGGEPLAEAERLVAQQARGEVEWRAAGRFARSMPPARPSRRTGTRRRPWSGRRWSVPIRRRKPRYSVQQRSATCWPLSSSRPFRSNENVAPPSRERAS